MSALARACMLQNQLLRFYSDLEESLQVDRKELIALSLKVSLAIQEIGFPSPCGLYEKPESLKEGEGMAWDNQILFISSTLIDKIQNKVKNVIEESLMECIKSVPEDLLSNHKNLFCLSDFYPLLQEKEKRLIPPTEVWITPYIEEDKLKVKVERLDAPFAGRGREISCSLPTFIPSFQARLPMLTSMGRKFSAVSYYKSRNYV